MLCICIPEIANMLIVCLRSIHKTNLGKDRKCAKCNAKIAGPGVTIDRENSSMEYHRDCIFCDDCNNKLNTFTMKIYKDSIILQNVLELLFGFQSWQEDWGANRRHI